jgi:hypothetical protein
MTVAVSQLGPRVDWLVSDRVVAPNGAVRSWWNPDHPGYAYPEIAGYLLSLLAFEGLATVPIRDRIARRLVADMSADGGVGRGGTDFVFDSAMALTGLISHEAIGGTIPGPDAVDRLFGYVTRTLLDRRAYTGGDPGDDTHWSRSYGCHLLKTSIALMAYDARMPGVTVDPLLDRLRDDLTPLYDAGRFRTNATSEVSYLHAHCYAIEGLMAMEELDPRCGELIDGGAAWLAGIQDPTGGIHAWHDGKKAYGPLRSDATAQAVRIWSCVDRGAFTPAIDRALAFLASMTTPEGGLRYEPGSEDTNTWASIFGLQAIRWADEGGTWQWIA